MIAVAFGRWGSYLKIPGLPVYWADLAVFAGVAFFAYGTYHTAGVQDAAGRMVRYASLMYVPAVLAGVATVSNFSITTIRDAVPFVYLSMTPIFAAALNLLGRDRVFSYLRLACVLHTLWVAPAILGLLPTVPLPLIGGIEAFTTRGDFDLLICGLSIAVISYERRWTGASKTLLVAANLAAILSSGSRAGLIGALLVILIASACSKPFHDRSKGPVRFAALFAIAAVALLVFVLFASRPPAWAVGLTKLLPSDSATYQTGQNTWQARLDAWELIYRYTGGSDGGFALLGSGFGSQPIRDSGAIRYLSGNEQVRAAHNYAVTWYAFLGAVGVSLVLVALILSIVAIFRGGLNVPRNVAIGRGLSVAILAVGLGGVIMESPFGYITMAFALALGLSDRSTMRRDRWQYGKTA
ncbi:hypothetical protein [Rhodococcus sp. SORGH_AS_0303]|uniref:hypothetical protein n=1 Tax=Rhodococcus sp. SORGH_AS_0303 TaxID=3041753 RepID=UPI0027D7CA27|nr:hypothetical protein [Rhodococcus sp. SORGH_AS_0303]